MFPPSTLFPPHASYPLHVTLRPLPYHASFLPWPTHSPPRTIIRIPKASNFLCYLLQPLASPKAIPLFLPFDQLVSPVLNPTSFCLCSMRQMERKTVHPSCSTEQKAMGQGVVSICQSIRSWGVEGFLLPLSFVAMLTVYRGDNLSPARLGRRVRKPVQTPYPTGL